MSDSMTPVKLRPELLRFAEEMEKRLRANDHKGGWEDDSDDSLLARLREETNELADALAKLPGRSGDQLMVTLEAADVANFAMMIADQFGARR